jgi:hypothetical protein
MHGFYCGEFSRPVYFGLRTLKQNILGGVTGRDALSVAIRAASHLYQQPGGAELLRNFHEELQTTAPSELAPFFAAGVGQGAPESEQDTDTTSPPPAEAQHERVVHMAGR